MTAKKTLPRGYNEIAQLIQHLSAHRLPAELQDKPVETSIASILDALLHKRIAVAKCLLEMMLQFQNQDKEMSIIAWLLSQCPPDKAIKNIEEFMSNKEVPDKIKRKLLLVLEQYGQLDKLSRCVAYVTDKEALADHALNSLLEYIGAAGDNLNHVFKHLTSQETDFYHALTANLTYRTDEQSLWLLGLLAELPNAAVADSAIQALGYRKSPLAYELLENIITHQEDSKEVRLKAMNRLAQSGISRDSTRMMAPHKCYLSWIDSSGNRILLVSRRTGRGRLAMVTFMLHEENGVQDCTIWNDISSFEMDSLIKGLETQTGLKQVDYSISLQMVEHCLYKTIQNKRLIPPNFLIARRIFGAQKLAPHPYEISLEEMGIQYVEKKLAELLSVSESLIKDHPFSEWAIDTPEAVEFVKNRPSLIGTKKIRKDILTQFVKICFESKREKWQERFLFTAEFLHRTSPRTYRAQIEIGLAIYLSLKKGTPFAEIPFMIELSQLSIQRLVEMQENKESTSKSAE